jgi:diaminohydroxyphosphoribosylaminopyrimidine deaminase/5-amino-6-(5-phosphoribosylamino)uracil reductase
VVRAADADGLLELASTLKLIAALGITRLMVEGGPTLAAALLAADLIDEAVLFHSPKVVGADGIDPLEGMPLAALTESPRLKCVAREAVGPDMRTVFERR